MTEKELQALLDLIAVEETQKLLKDLATNFSPHTRIINVPRNTKRFAVSISQTPVRGKLDPFVDYVWINLYHFFGMYVGFDPEHNILVYWQPLLKGEK